MRFCETVQKIKTGRFLRRRLLRKKRSQRRPFAHFWAATLGRLLTRHYLKPKSKATVK